jgi:3-hydroxyisobutyrate dehydrogenase-like beta-hydroxyacid dehydrogenase
MKIGFIGLGHMGSAMANRLIAAGHELKVYNRTPEKTKPFAQRGAAIAVSPREAATGVDLLVSMLADDAAVASTVLIGENSALSGLPRGSVHLSASTISPDLSIRLARSHRDAGQRYVAAPVLGRPEAAEQGELVIIAAGAAEAIEACRPLFDVLGKEVYVLGEDPAQANVVKLGANLVFAMMIEALGESFALVESYGVDDGRFLDILNGSLLKSPVVAAYGQRLVERKFEPAGFRLALGAKDVRLAVEAAEERAVPLPLASVLRDRFVAAIAEGHADEDWSAVGRASTGRTAA